MNTSPNSISAPHELGRLLVVYWRRWLVTALMITAVAAVYAILSPKSWQSSQAMIVRNEAVGSDADSVRFHGPDELKSIQETIVELSKSRKVLHAALADVGPPADRRQASDWSSDAEVEELQKNVKIAPPKGVELGASEVFYLEVRDKDRQRAADLGTAISRQLQRDLQDIRDAKARSMIKELEKAAQVAKSDLTAATVRLTALETEVGSDLSELRSLLDSNSSDTALRRTVSEVENELRQFRAAVEANRQLRDLLTAAQADPTRLMAAPTRLLESQPALRRLKEGLVDAQLRTAALQGRMSAEHPQVIAAREAEAQVADRLHAEIATAILGVDAEQAVAVGRVQSLEQQRERAAARLKRLAGLRANYTNLLSESSSRAKLLDRAEQGLNNARSTLAGAKAASLISAVDDPDTGTHPISPSRSLVILGGLLGGLLTGLGLVFLTAPATSTVQIPAASVVARPAVTMPVPYRAPEYLPQSHAAAAESRSMTVAAQDSLNCAQALKILSERGRLSGTPA